MKPSYITTAAEGLDRLMPDDNAKYQSKLKKMAGIQISELQAGETTYQVGVDFMTNQPHFRLRGGKDPDQRSIEIMRALFLQVRFI